MIFYYSQQPKERVPPILTITYSNEDRPEVWFSMKMEGVIEMGPGVTMAAHVLMEGGVSPHNSPPLQECTLHTESGIKVYSTVSGIGRLGTTTDISLSVLIGQLLRQANKAVVPCNSVVRHPGWSMLVDDESTTKLYQPTKVGGIEKQMCIHLGDDLACHEWTHGGSLRETVPLEKSLYLRQFYWKAKKANEQTGQGVISDEGVCFI